MSVMVELSLECTGGKLYFSKFAGQVVMLPVVEKVGDQITLNDYQVKRLKIWLEEHLKC